MTSHIVGLDMMEIRRVLERWNLPIQMFQPGIKLGIAIFSYGVDEITCVE